MKHAKAKTPLVTGSVLFAVAHAAMVSAHDIRNASLGNAKAAKDVYEVTCDTLSGNVTDHLAFAVEDLAPVATPVLKIQVRYPTDGSTVTGSDPVDNDGSPGPEKELKKGNGVYIMTIKKNMAGKENYHVIFHCESKTGFETTANNVQLRNR